MTTDDELIAQILMMLCFMPVFLWLALHAWEYLAHRWVRPFVMRQMMFRAARANQRVSR